MLFNRFLSILGGPRSRAIFVALIAPLLLWARRPWSAAMLVAATASMGAINTAIKAVVRRQRPKGIPGLRQAGGYSFPSGHSSGSVVFLGTVAYLIWRLTLHRFAALAAMLIGGTLAAGIGRSRVRLKAHHSSDVFAGFGLGAAWLLLILRLFAGKLDGEEKRAEDEQGGPLTADERSVVLVTSPSAGSAGQALDTLEDRLHQAGLRVLETIPITALDRLDRWVGTVDGERPVVVAAGGDGTVGSVAGHLVGTGVPLGILPLGTSNDIARSLDIPMRLKKAIRVLREGESAPIDIARFDAVGKPPRYFLHAATAGINVAFARVATQSSFRKRLGRLTYLAAGLIALGKVEPFACDVTIDGHRTSLCLLQICVIDAPVFGGLLHFEVPDSEIDDRRLDVLAIDDMPLTGLALTALRILIGRQKPVKGIRLYHVQEIDVSPSEPLEVTLDGEIAGRIPGKFALHTEALLVIRPR
jgi:YegS/Rv2252/BmrU family lipid kinase